ncbi:MAG: MMPL family transporter [Jatrophihabitantaceae bacterium]
MSENAVEPRRPVTVRVARWSATHPWRAIALWLAFVLASIAIGSAAGLKQMSDLDATPGQAGQAARMLHDADLSQPATENVLITSPGGRLDRAAADRAAATVTTRMRALHEVTTVDPPALAKNGSAVLVEVTMRGDPQKAGDHVAPLLTATKAVQHEFPALRVEQVGGASLNNAVNDQVNSDLGSAADFSLPVTLVILLIAFGAIVAAGVPVLLALSAVGSATGLSSLASHLVPDSGTTSSMILLMGMAVGIDYSLFYVKRARAERHNGHSHLDAIEIAADTSGHSVIVSGVAVIVAMCGLFLAHSAVFSSLATGSIIVVAVAVLGSLTVLPAVLVKLGRAIDRPRVPVLWRWSTQVREPRLWPALLKPALTRPGRTLAISVVALGALAAPALTMKLQSGTVKSLPSSIAEVHSFDRMAAAFPSQQATHDIVVQGPASASDAIAARLRALTRTLDGNPLFVAGSGLQHASSDRTVHLLQVSTPFDPESASAKKGLHELRDTLVPQAVHGVAHVTWAVGGDTAGNVDTDTGLSDAMPWVIGFVVLLTMLMMGWVFRSVVIALMTAAVNLLSAGAAFGVLVLTFQHTWAEHLLGFHSTGAVINWIPLFTFAVLFGLSMDYHVFVLSQVRECVRNGMTTRDAVRVGITRSAGTVTSAAIVMVSVFAIFASLHMVEMKELGISLAVAVLLDALVVRVIVLPSLMTMLGRWNWWPGSGLGKRHRTVDLARAVEQPDLSHAGVG